GGGWCNNVTNCLARKNTRLCSGHQFTLQGARIFHAVLKDLLAKGMQNAQNAIISGCSAGGLTSILHCDKFHELLPPSTKVKCIADAGFFYQHVSVSKDVSEVFHIENFYNDLVTTHGSAKNLPAAFTSAMKPGLCFFPQNMAKLISTPLFIINAAYNSWQVTISCYKFFQLPRQSETGILTGVPSRRLIVHILVTNLAITESSNQMAIQI
ncbi:hypothetical protein GIB67_024657, partial [Kingdonia uniflora]